MKSIIIKTSKKIEDFFLLRNRFNGHCFTDTNYTAYSTMKGIPRQGNRPSHVYHGADIKNGDLIVKGMIHIASQMGLPESHTHWTSYGQVCL